MVSLENTVSWRATFVYGEPRCELRHEFWDLLQRLHRQRDGPWICCGDFNEALTHDEHFGTRDRSHAQMELFRSCLEDCGLRDLGYAGPKLTWTKRREDHCNVKVRLDRAVANGAFTALFEYYQVENVITTSSHHFVISISLNSHSSPHNPPVQMWRRTADYNGVVEASWLANNDVVRSLQATWSNLNRMAGSLRDWSRMKFGSIRKQMQNLERKLHIMRLAPVSVSDLTEERKLEKTTL
ncbi:unnamed protein product [Cuscuta europaea]|uniref:Endonuclease/exonuclease/phosphatase domain-containing protein n=1 Tax=Cuscuta europaea TaxID=41803 RepID=A0A9P1E4H3_CUSEU|nr:unnamed protein product [Cuscuta europaea]